ncbi:ATP-binding protein [Streptomyces sp. JV176]|uniref:sensor histidine kinase n=1 Tax=Streptomyces sp. JV176 TaxID=858630 RepID=UPI002E75CD82|nr:ATP-binding protein [Streptomyces sp. JV176]MEE1800585.1 ATP-binding protein [Streptomyces sp. JV176]
MRRSLRFTAPALLISAAVSGLLCLWAVSDAPTAVRTPLAWGGAAALVAAVTAVAHLTATREQLRERNARLAARIERLEGDVERAAEDVRHAVADARRGADAVSRSESHRAAALSACANAAGRMQALATGMLADLRQMEHRHTDEDVLGDLLHLDHRTAQAGRLADSLAVLTGARSGRRWAKPIVMESILRGAMGRISGYQRVRLHSTSQVAIAGHAAEGVMHALAELLDNAANFSPPTAEVHVYVEEVPAGIVITVEDSGLVMSDVQLRRAEQAVTAVPSDLSGLSGTRLGLAVVGRLARKHGLTVSFRPSARGGTGALMMLPQDLITQLRPGAPAAPRPTKASASAPPPAASDRTPPPREEPTAADPAADPAADAPPPTAPAPDPDPEPAAKPAPASAPTSEPAPELGESGLPKRRRGRTLAASMRRTGEGASATSPAPTAPVTSPAVQAARFSSFRKAVRDNPQRPATTTHPDPEGDSR